MRFKLDENLPRAPRAVLAEHGWDVHDVYEEGLARALDTVIRAVCEQEERILVTLDTDFADVRLVDPVTSPGVILLRPPDQSIQSTVSCLRGAVRLLATETPRGALWLVARDRVRVRRRGSEQPGT